LQPAKPGRKAAVIKGQNRRERLQNPIFPLCENKARCYMREP
jgi:hypothetical protein